MPKPDPLEARTRVADYLDPHRGLSLSAIAHRVGANVGNVSRSLQLAFLAPDLVEAILDGTQPVALTPERLKRACELPLLWDEQRATLGVDELEGGDLRGRSGAGREVGRGRRLSTGQADPRSTISPQRCSAPGRTFEIHPGLPRSHRYSPSPGVLSCCRQKLAIGSGATVSSSCSA